MLAVTGGMRVRLPVGSGMLRVEFTITVTVAENPWAVKLVPVGKNPVEFADAGGTPEEAVTGAVVLANGVSSGRIEETVTTTVVSGETSVVALELGTGSDPDPVAVGGREKSPVRLSSVELRTSVVVLFDTTSTVVVELRDTGGGVTEARTVVVALNVGAGTDPDTVGDREKSPVRLSSVELRTSVVVLFDTTSTVVVELRDTGGGVTEAGTSVVALNVGAGTDSEAVGGLEKSPVRLSSVELRTSL
jgi:hypothetical protein